MAAGLGSLIVWLLWPLCAGMGSLPDASQEGLLWQYKGYSSVALFHYSVPRQVTRATWEFAAFQDEEKCPSRSVKVWLQHGSFPVFQTNLTGPVPAHFYRERTQITGFQISSEFQPTYSKVIPVYNPLPGNWFAVAYMDPFEENLGVGHKCRYSVGSIALWSKADDVSLILPNGGPQTFETVKRWTYLKFFSPDDVGSFNVTISGCDFLNKFRNRSCIEYVGMRGKALPVQGNGDHFKNVTEGGNVTFIERRPFRSEYYYLIVVSGGRVKFNVTLNFQGCGQAGVYGVGQRDWYFDERGLHRGSNPKNKEPETGFQLFSRSGKVSTPTVHDFRVLEDPEERSKSCISTFDFTRIDNTDPFSAGYLLQGRSWYTKWLTVAEKRPVFTRFKILDFHDIGGHLSVKIHFDSVVDKGLESKDYDGVQQMVTGCLSYGRQPRLNDEDIMICDNHDSSLKLYNTRDSNGTFKTIPYPEPGLWYLGFQISCFKLKENGGKDFVECPIAEMRSSMISVNIMLQPCPEDEKGVACGQRGLCTTVRKGQYRLSGCTCSTGFKGWMCDEKVAHEHSIMVAGTLLLTLSNLGFIPAVALALKYKLFGEALVYFAAMISSIFYHICDEVTSSYGDFPDGFNKICASLYVNREVLQFCDFYAATLSMWITFVALVRFNNAQVIQFLNLLGVLVVAVLVQYNRTGLHVFIVPIAMGLLMLMVATVVRISKKKSRIRPNRRCAALVLAAISCSLLAVLLTSLVTTTYNYAYVHSAWHLLLAASLALLVPRCKIIKKRALIESSTSQTECEEDDLKGISTLASVDPTDSLQSMQMSQISDSQN